MQISGLELAASPLLPVSILHREGLRIPTDSPAQVHMCFHSSASPSPALLLLRWLLSDHQLSLRTSALPLTGGKATAGSGRDLGTFRVEGPGSQAPQPRGAEVAGPRAPGGNVPLASQASHPTPPWERMAEEDQSRTPPIVQVEGWPLPRAI